MLVVVAMMDTTPNLGGLKPELLKIDVFVHTLLAIACKTMSHSFAAIAKFHFVMKKLAGQDAPDRQVQILLSLYEIWKNHPQMMQGIIDKLLKTQVIDASAVANWVFSEELKADFTKYVQLSAVFAPLSIVLYKHLPRHCYHC